MAIYNACEKSITTNRWKHIRFYTLNIRGFTVLSALRVSQHKESDFKTNVE